MSDPDAPRADRPDDLRALMDIEREPTPAVADALTELEAARSAAVESLDQLTSATQSALDIPAKIRRHPVRTAALIGGTGFLLAGGPRRVIRSASSRLRPSKPDPRAGLLPPQIERVLRDAGLADDPEVRRALDEDFADYLRQKGRHEFAPGPAASFWRTFDRVAGPLGTAGARILVQRLMEADQDRSSALAEGRREARQKRAPGE